MDTNFETRFERIARLARRIVQVPLVLVTFLDGKPGCLRSGGLDLPDPGNDASFWRRTLAGEGLFVVPDASQDPQFLADPLVTGAPQLRFFAGHPLSLPNGTRIGTLSLIDPSPRMLGPDDRQAIVDLAGIAEREIYTAQSASEDELTALSNRKGFGIMAQYSLNLARRQNSPATLLFLNLDSFRPDAHEHQAEGNRVIRAFADVLRSVLRNSDVIGRHGREVFLALLTDTDLIEVGPVLRRLNDSIEDYIVDGKLDRKVDYRIGMIKFDPVRHASVEDLIREAGIELGDRHG